MYIGGLCIGGLGEGGSSLKKGSLSLATSPLRYTHTMFVFLPSFSQGIFMTLWTFFGKVCLATSPPKGSHIYIYTHTHTMFVLPPSFFPGNLRTFFGKDVAKTLHFQKRGKMGTWQRPFLDIYIYICIYIRHFSSLGRSLSPVTAHCLSGSVLCNSRGPTALFALRFYGLNWLALVLVSLGICALPLASPCSGVPAPSSNPGISLPLSRCTRPRSGSAFAFFLYLAEELVRFLCISWSSTLPSWWTSGTITPTQRRRTRRLRSFARFRWFLHRTGRQPLNYFELLNIKNILSGHHSADRNFQHLIVRAMEQWNVRQAPWKCRTCRRLNKAAAAYCGQCGKHWEEALDASYRHVQRPSHQGQEQQAYTQWSTDPPWHQHAWDDGRGISQSPRSYRSQTPKSQRQPKNRGKNKGKKGKGKGKGTQQFQAPPLPEAPWSTTSPSSTVAASTAPPTQAEVQLRSIVAALKKNETNLPAELQTLLHENAKVQSQDMTKVLHSAVSKLGKAKKSLQDARAARLNLHQVWRSYLDASVDKWHQFCKDFETQDSELAQQVQNATDAVKIAQEGLEASKKEAKEIIEVESDGRSEMAVEVSDEETQEAMDSKGQLLKDGMNFMLQNLESLKSKADMAVLESATKRPRIHADEQGDSRRSSPPDFAQPGQ